MVPFFYLLAAAKSLEVGDIGAYVIDTLVLLLLSTGLVDET
jgi:hypothetical protein